MKTNNNIKNFARRIDEIIPDATPENVKGQCKDIKSDLKNTGKCAMATLTCAGGTAIFMYRTLEDSVMLGLMLSKTETKKIHNAVKNFYNNTPSMTVAR